MQIGWLVGISWLVMYSTHRPFVVGEYPCVCWMTGIVAQETIAFPSKFKGNSCRSLLILHVGACKLIKSWSWTFMNNFWEYAWICLRSLITSWKSWITSGNMPKVTDSTPITRFYNTCSLVHDPWGTEDYQLLFKPWGSEACIMSMYIYI